MKLVIEEQESQALADHLRDRPTLATSRLALVEVARATALANPGAEVQRATGRLLDACVLVDLGHELLRAAARLTSRTVRTLDAIHLASALRVDADEFLAYDRPMLAAAIQLGLVASHPGAEH